MDIHGLTENIGDKKAAYREFLKDILNRSDVLDAQAVLSIQRLVRDMQQSIVERVGVSLRRGKAYEIGPDGNLTQWGQFWVPRLRAAISDVVAEISAKAGPLLGDFLRDSWEIGSELVDGSIKAVAPGIEIVSPRISMTTMTTLAPFSAQLITRISKETLATVDKTIRRNIALGSAPGKLIDELELDFRGKPSPWKSVAYRAEIVTRTEVARAQSLGREARVQQAALEYPELIQGNNRMQYKFVAVQRGPWPCKICEPLDGTLWDVDDPKKPEIPLHPNCRCILSPVFRGINATAPIPKPTDERLQRAKITECVCCH